jgi:hypothetical protein
MSHGNFADRVKETSTTTGTGDFTLAGAVAQFEAFTTNFALQVKFYYAIVGQTGTEWEIGLGLLSGTTTLVRTRVLQSSNSDALVSFSAGTKDVFVPIPSHFVNDVQTTGKSIAQLTGNALP